MRVRRGGAQSLAVEMESHERDSVGWEECHETVSPAWTLNSGDLAEGSVVHVYEKGFAHDRSVSCAMQVPYAQGVTLI